MTIFVFLCLVVWWLEVKGDCGWLICWLLARRLIH